jgi:hypothetical protein
MAFKRKSYPVHQKDVEAFSEMTVYMAVLIDSGFVTHWPHEWTRAGNRSRRRAVIEGRGYDATMVFNDANQQLGYANVPRAFIKPSLGNYPSAFEAQKKLRLMKGDAVDAEAID